MYARLLFVVIGMFGASRHILAARLRFRPETRSVLADFARLSRVLRLGIA